jgi:DNA processing protein
MNTHHLLIALNAADCITRSALCRLATCLDTWWDVPPSDVPRLSQKLGVPVRQLYKARALRSRVVALAEGELQRAERLGYHIFTLGQETYPEPLLDLPLPPPVLYCRGKIPERPSIAMVGSRKMNEYGHRAANLFGRHLAGNGITVVSGFARGVDVTAHRAALAAEDGHTIAVLGCGLDRDYPKGSTALAQAIAERGAVLSEFAFGVEPRSWHFPVRNRVIAGLSLGTLVVQAAPRSGSLITAHLALELGREVWAVPGPIFDPLSTGTNELIADGAAVALSPEDIIDSFALGRQQLLFPTVPLSTSIQSTDSPPVEKLPPGLPGRLLGALPPGESLSADDLAMRLEVAVDRVLSALLDLELDGRIQRAPGPVYSR